MSYAGTVAYRQISRPLLEYQWSKAAVSCGAWWAREQLAGSPSARDCLASSVRLPFLRADTRFALGSA